MAFSNISHYGVLPINNGLGQVGSSGIILLQLWLIKNFMAPSTFASSPIEVKLDAPALPTLEGPICSKGVLQDAKTSSKVNMEVMANRCSLGQGVFKRTNKGKLHHFYYSSQGNRTTNTYIWYHKWRWSVLLGRGKCVFKPDRIIGVFPKFLLQNAYGGNLVEIVIGGRSGCRGEAGCWWWSRNSFKCPSLINFGWSFLELYSV